MADDVKRLQQQGDLADSNNSKVCTLLGRFYAMSTSRELSLSISCFAGLQSIWPGSHGDCP